MGWALIRGWALINFFCLWDGRLFEVGANSRLGAYSNKYGIHFHTRSYYSVQWSVLNTILETFGETGLEEVGIMFLRSVNIIFGSITKGAEKNSPK